MTLPAWRPLKDAPKVWSVIAVRGLGMDRVAMYREGDGEEVKRWRVFNEPEISPLIEPLWEYAPIADTLELDRAVQSEIARAFGALIQAMVDAEYYLSLRGPNSSYDLIYADNADGTFRAGTRAFRGILHTAMGGRIPDGVP